MVSELNRPRRPIIINAGIPDDLFNVLVEIWNERSLPKFKEEEE